MTGPDRTRLGQFLGILLVFAVLVQAIALATGLSPITLAPLYMFTPLVAGVTVCVRNDITLERVSLRIGRVRWLVVSALVSLPLVGLTLLIALAVPDIGFDPAADAIPGLELPPGIPGLGIVLVIALISGATINAVFAFGEEFGWRGYLLWELAPLGFWPASIIIGATWGLWHAPIILAGYNFPAFPVIGVAVMTLACISFSPLYTFLVLRARSVFAAAVLHGVFNGSAGLVVVYATTEDPVLRNLVANAVGAAGILAFGLAGLAIALLGVPALSRAVIETGA